MPPKDANGKEKHPAGWVCRVCTANVQNASRGYCNPKHQYAQLCIYGKWKVCKHGHPKDGKHLCAWAAVEEKFKQRKASQKAPGVPSTVKTIGEKKAEQENAKLRAEVARLQKQATGMDVDADGETPGAEEANADTAGQKAEIQKHIAYWVEAYKIAKKAPPEDEDQNREKRIHGEA